MSVIMARALPDIRDGLKPSQRRILVAMNDLNLGPRAQTKKCAKISGDTSGNYHPHGESVIYPTLVRMAQPWNMRQPLIDGQGNFGSIDGDPPAAMRYTEARMTNAAAMMLDDLEYETVDFIPNYDNSREEPTVLPGKFPNLNNGATGIAVGRATNLPPHNVGEAATCWSSTTRISRRTARTSGSGLPTGGIQAGGRRRRLCTGTGTPCGGGATEEGRAGSPSSSRKAWRCWHTIPSGRRGREGRPDDVVAIATPPIASTRPHVDLKAGPTMTSYQSLSSTPPVQLHIMNIALVDRQPKR
jgi:hypothetical protein